MSARFALAAVGVLVLAGCAASPVTEPDPEPVPSDEVEAEDCLVGTWALDVADYAAQSQEYVLGLGIPLEDFAMSGAGQLGFTPDGLVAVDIDLRTTGTLVAGDQRIPIDVPSVYTASGDWSRVDDASIQFDNWAKVTDTPDVPPEVDLPALDVTQLTDVAAECDAGELSLSGSGAPLSAHWTR